MKSTELRFFQNSSVYVDQILGRRSPTQYCFDITESSSSHIKHFFAKLIKFRYVNEFHNKKFNNCISKGRFLLYNSSFPNFNEKNF